MPYLNFEPFRPWEGDSESAAARLVVLNVGDDDGVFHQWSVIGVRSSPS